MSNHPLVVTRHKALVVLLRERGIIADTADVREQVTAAEVTGRDVIGVLPLALACLARSITEIPLVLTLEQRGKELGLEEIRLVAGEARTYVVRRQDELAYPVGRAAP